MNEKDKRVYKCPTLTIWGRVEEMTQSTMSGPPNTSLNSHHHKRKWVKVGAGAAAGSGFFMLVHENDAAVESIDTTPFSPFS